MIKKIAKEIQKLEIQKGIKIEKRKEIDEDINELTTNLKELYSLKSQYEKLENNAKSFLKKE